MLLQNVGRRGGISEKPLLFGRFDYIMLSVII